MTERREEFSRKKPFFNVYKPNAKSTVGSAAQFSYDDHKKAIFLEMCPQNGELLPKGSKGQFNWPEDKLTFKLGDIDIGQLLLVFNGRKTEAKLIHKPQNPEVTNNYTSVVELKKQSGKYDNYLLKLSRTETNNENKRETRAVSVYIDHHEMAILSAFIRESLVRMLGFN